MPSTDKSDIYEVLTIPCLADNYAYLIGNRDTRQAALVDVPEAAPIAAALTAQGWTLAHVLLTHHHWDHVDGLPDLALPQGCTTLGAAADAHRLPALDHALSEGNTIDILGLETRIIDVSGHTMGHIAFHMPQIGALFTADSLMALGCGRLFEGTPADMLKSLSKLAALPGETLVYSGHEYTQTNARFAKTVDPLNKALESRHQQIISLRQAGQPTVPSSLRLELDTNPFLRADDPQIAAHLGMTGASTLEIFTEIRSRRNSF